MIYQRPNLKNLSHVSNLSRGSNMFVPLEIVFSVSRFEPVLNWDRFLAVQRRGLNSLNSVSFYVKSFKYSNNAINDSQGYEVSFLLNSDNGKIAASYRFIIGQNLAYLIVCFFLNCLLIFTYLRQWRGFLEENFSENCHRL